MASRRGTRRQKIRVASGTEAVDGVTIGFEVWEELRRDTRFSLTQRKAFLRMPFSLSLSAKQEQLAAFKVWLKEAIKKRPDLRDAQIRNTYRHGETWCLGNRCFQLHIKEEQRKTGGGRIIQLPTSPLPLLSLKLPAGIAPSEHSRMVEQLLYRLAAKHALSRIEEILDEENDKSFRVDVGRIKLSPTTTRWGSCSSTGNINLSTRLLGAPEMCLRAVIVHELAHRIEMNHSERFWKLVYNAMPEYDKADQWLKEEGRSVGWKKRGDN